MFRGISAKYANSPKIHKIQKIQRKKPKNKQILGKKEGNSKKIQKNNLKNSTIILKIQEKLFVYFFDKHRRF